jgi:hypothetical protein
MDVWQFWEPPRQPWGNARLPWKLSMNLPGATQMKHVRALIESRPFFTRIPDQVLLVDDRGDSLFHLRATRDSEGSYALIYCPDSQPFTVNLDRLPGTRLKAWWFNPRTGNAAEIATLRQKGRKAFTPPVSPNPWNDWVLVLDDGSRNFPPPGSK